VAAGLTAEALQERLEDGARALALIQPGVEVTSPAGSWRLPTDAEVARVQVIAGPLTGSLLASLGVDPRRVGQAAVRRLAGLR
jgi:hypothetical protein